MLSHPVADFILMFVVFNGLKTNKNGSEIFSAYPT